MKKLWAWWHNTFLKPTHKQTPAERRRANGLIWLGGVILLAVGLGGLWWLASINADPTDAVWELVLLARIALFRVPTGLVISFLAVATAIGILKWLVATPQGRFALLWDDAKDSESDEIKAAKLRNTGMVFASLVLGSFVFWALLVAGK